MKKTESLPEKIAQIIMDLIVEKNLEAGTKIPNEFEIAKKLGVGRSTVREAVRLLASRHILDVKRGSGTFVADKTGVTEDPLGLFFESDKISVAWDLVNVRLVLEPEIAAWAAINATDEEAQKIEEQCNILEATIKQGDDFASEDMKFHKMIARCSNNSIMEKLVPIITQSVAVFCDVTNNELKDETIATHREITNAIKQHDPTSARLAMNMHLTYNRRMIAEIVDLEKDK